jgi:hypothetical protein
MLWPAYICVHDLKGIRRDQNKVSNLKQIMVLFYKLLVLVQWPQNFLSCEETSGADGCTYSVYCVSNSRGGRRPYK